MIHEIGVEINALLAARGCPLRVVDGPEAAKTTTFGRERIVLEYAGTDSFSAPKTSTMNPKQRFTRSMAMTATVYAKDPRTGALEFEHRRRCDQVVDMLLVAIHDVAYTRKNLFEIKGGEYFIADDLNKSETIGGASYRLSFTFDRGITARVSWATEKAAEHPLASGEVTGTTKVYLVDDDSDLTTIPSNAETGCGI